MMAQLQRTARWNQGKQQHSSLAFIYVGLVFGMLFLTALVSGTFYVLNAAFGRPAAQPFAYAAQLKHVHLNLSILMNQPGMQKDWPGYSNTNLVVPANSVVTVTLHNYDLGDTLFPAGSPFGKVQGTVGNVAAADGTMYAALALDKIAHTFTITQLRINVPIPGDAPNGATYATASS